MPWKSKAQMRKFFALHKEGKISKETLKEWQEATPNPEALPERVKKAGVFIKSFEKTASGNLPLDASIMAQFDDQESYSSGSTLRPVAETGQARGRATRTRGVLNEDREMDSRYKRKYQTARPGVNYGNTFYK